MSEIGQAQYWDQVAGQIKTSQAPSKDLVGYHSPYDVHVRGVALGLLESATNKLSNLKRIAELGSGAGLNLRYFAAKKPQQLYAFDCSSELLGLAKANLVDVANVEFIHTSGNDLPVPNGAALDLLYTMTVLQHIVKPEMFASVTRSMQSSGARYLLAIEDTHEKPRRLSDHYTWRTPQDYVQALAGGEYVVEAMQFASLTWAARFYGAINRVFRLYGKDEGAQLPCFIFTLTRVASPLVRWLDRTFPGPFGMSALLLKRRDAAAMAA